MILAQNLLTSVYYTRKLTPCQPLAAGSAADVNTAMIKQPVRTFDQVLGEIYGLPEISRFGLMELEEKILLRDLSKNLAAHSIIVEVGCFMGSSTAILADANPQVQVHSFDPFDQMPNSPRDRIILDECLGQGKERTIDNVRARINRPNVTLHQGFSPQDFSQWDQPIDMYFEDGLHQDPALRDNVYFWTSKLKQGGILAIHDYRPWLPTTDRSHWPDVITLVQELKASTTWKFLAQAHSTVVFKKLV